MSFNHHYPQYTPPPAPMYFTHQTTSLPMRFNPPEQQVPRQQLHAQPRVFQQDAEQPTVWLPPSRRASALAGLQQPMTALRPPTNTPFSAGLQGLHSQSPTRPRYIHSRTPSLYQEPSVRSWSPESERSQTPQYPVKAPPPTRLRRQSSEMSNYTHDLSHRDEVPPTHEYLCSAAGIDLNSSLCKTPSFSFVDSDLHHTPIYVFEAVKPLLTCMRIKQWLVNQCSTDKLRAPGILRMESQDFELLDQRKTAHLVMLQDAAHLDSDPRLPITIFALFSKGDGRVRWYYTLLSCSSLLRQLGVDECLAPKVRALHPRTHKHRRLFVFLRESFTTAVKIPEHPDYLAAQQLTDYCPSIMGPETAFDRLLAHNSPSKTNPIPNANRPITPSKDRYTPHFPPAEVYLATILSLPVSSYLLLKRRFFIAFWRDLVTSKERIGYGRRKVRTEHAHEAWLVNECGWKGSKAKNLVVGWRVLGLLEETRFLGALGEGRMAEGGDGDNERDGEEGVGPDGVVGVGPDGVVGV